MKSAEMQPSSDNGGATLFHSHCHRITVRIGPSKSPSRKVCLSDVASRQCTAASVSSYSPLRFLMSRRRKASAPISSINLAPVAIHCSTGISGPGGSAIQGAT